MGTEVYNVYDAAEPGESAQNAGNASFLVGRLSATYSRGEHTNYAYDGRGRVTQVSRQMPGTSAESATGALSNRYDAWWYRSNMLYDNANRRTGQTTGADATALQGSAVDGFTNLVSATFDARDIPVQVGGSYGPIVSNEQHAPDGLLNSRTYADVAVTTASYGYDSRRRLGSSFVARSFYNQWVNPTSTYTIPFNGSQPDYTTPTVLQKLSYVRDLVGNPLTIWDGRGAGEWPSNEGPVVSTGIQYDDRYRVRAVSYGYTNGTAETQASGYVSTDPPAISFEAPASRSGWQTYQYDWQGNVVTSDDDAHALLQRSSGTAVYGSAGLTPNQVRSGSGPHGSYTTTYDAAGNLISLNASLAASTTETLALTMTYDWDEAGHLRTVKRGEVTSTDASTTCGRGGCVFHPSMEVSSSTIANAYLYDGSGQRTWHASNNTGAEAYTLEVFPSLHVNQVAWSGSTYERSAANEQSYLLAAGGSYGRLVADTSHTLPSPKGATLHVYIQIADPLGSTSSMIDRDSSELVEQATYLAYGQAETDYRPTRWQSFREGYRYTGQEDDYDVGLTYFGARYYVPGLNRWASADPLTIHGLGADINPYSFVRSNPMRYVDPFGLDGADPASGSGNQTNPGSGGGGPTINGEPAPGLGGEITGPPPPPASGPPEFRPGLTQEQEFQVASDTWRNMWAATQGLGAAVVTGSPSLGVAVVRTLGAPARGVYPQTELARSQIADNRGAAGHVVTTVTSALPFACAGIGVAFGADAAGEAFSSTELAVVNEVKAIPLGQLQEAFQAGGAELSIGGRTILVEPGVPASGMTLFGENGFILGREAFASEAELTQTLLHETFRLLTSDAAGGVSGELATSETSAAASFAARAFAAFFAP